MASDLYRRAVGGLGGQQATWQQRAQDIASIPADTNYCGKAALRNIEDEEQLKLNKSFVPKIVESVEKEPF